MGGQPGREAQVAEDDVLDARTHVGLAARKDLRRLLAARKVHHDRDVVGAKRPERVLVCPQLAEVEPVAVDVEDLAELAAVGELLELADARVVLEQVPDHQVPPRGLRRGDGALGVPHRLRERLLDKAVLAGL